MLDGALVREVAHARALSVLFRAVPVVSLRCLAHNNGVVITHLAGSVETHVRGSNCGRLGGLRSRFGGGRSGGHGGRESGGEYGGFWGWAGVAANAGALAGNVPCTVDFSWATVHVSAAPHPVPTTTNHDGFLCANGDQSEQADGKLHGVSKQQQQQLLGFV